MWTIRYVSLIEFMNNNGLYSHDFLTLVMFQFMNFKMEKRDKNAVQNMITIYKISRRRKLNSFPFRLCRHDSELSATVHKYLYF